SSAAGPFAGATLTTHASALLNFTVSPASARTLPAGVLMRAEISCSPFRNFGAPVSGLYSSVRIEHTNVACASASSPRLASPLPMFCEHTASPSTSTSSLLTLLPAGASNSTTTSTWPARLFRFAEAPAIWMSWITTVTGTSGRTVIVARPGGALGSACALASMTAVPADTPVTTPEASTVATLGVRELHVTAWFVELDTIAVSGTVCPTWTVAVAGATVTSIAGGGFTVTVVWPFAVGSATDVAMITAVPALLAVTTPDVALMLATSLLFDSHVTLWFVVPFTIALNVTWSPTFIVGFSGATVTSISGGGVTSSSSHAASARVSAVTTASPRTANLVDLITASE